jgi:hypothetical protein
MLLKGGVGVVIFNMWRRTFTRALTRINYLTAIPLQPTTMAATAGIRSLTAIDVALENMGLAQTYEDPDTGSRVTREILTSVHATADGRMYEYEEGQLVRLCYEWLATNECYWRGSKLVFLEKQWCENNNSKQRAGLFIQLTMESMFTMLYQMGVGPKPIVMKAEWWRGELGLPSTKNHAENKCKSQELFVKMFGQERFNSMKSKWGKVDDIVEANLMLVVLERNYDKFVVPEFPSFHVETKTAMRIPKEDRMRALPAMTGLPCGCSKSSAASFNTKPPYDPLALRRVYAEFTDRRKAAKNERRDKKVFVQNQRKLDELAGRSTTEPQKPKRRRKQEEGGGDRDSFE